MLYDLKKLRKMKGVSQEEAAQALDTPLGTYRTWEQCKFMPRDNKKLKEIADYLHVSIEALFGYDMVTPGTFTFPEVSNGHFRAVPVVLAVAAGKPDMWEVDCHMDVPEEIMAKHPEAYLVRVVGDSINRRILNGYYALVDPQLRDPNDHDLFAVCVNGDTATIKRVHKLANGLELIPDSYDPTIRPITYDQHEESDDPEVTIMGKVVYAVMPLDYSI